MPDEPREGRVQELAERLQASDGSEPEADQPTDSAPAEGGTSADDQQPEGAEDRFYELDLDRIPEDPQEAREWVARREKEMQAAFTRRTQEAAAARKEAEKIVEASNDPEQRLALLRAWGYDLEDEDSSDDYDDEYEEPTAQDFRTTKEWQEFQQFQQQLHQAAQQEQAENQFRDAVDQLETREGRELDDTEWELLWTLNTAGVDVDTGYERISSLRKSERKALVDAKKAPQVSPVGKSATQVPDLKDEQARVEYMAELMTNQSAD